MSAYLSVFCCTNTKNSMHNFCYYRSRSYLQ